MARHKYRDRRHGPVVRPASPDDISSPIDDLRGIDETVHESSQSFGDVIRAATREATGEGKRETAAAFHAVEIAAGALKRAAQDAIGHAGDDLSQILRDIIADL